MFNDEEKAKIQAAIKSAEENTSSDIHVQVVESCGEDIYQTAVDYFNEIGLHENESQSDILLFIAKKSKRLALIGDTTIHQKVGEEYWQQMVQELTAEFKREHFLDAVIDCIKDLGVMLAREMPES